MRRLRDKGGGGGENREEGGSGRTFSKAEAKKREETIERREWKLLLMAARQRPYLLEGGGVALKGVGPARSARDEQEALHTDMHEEDMDGFMHHETA